MSLRKHFKQHRVKYIAAGAAIGAGLAGAGAMYAYGVDPAGAFSTGFRAWGGNQRPDAPPPPPPGLGLSLGPNPLGLNTGFNLGGARPRAPEPAARSFTYFSSEASPSFHPPVSSSSSSLSSPMRAWSHISETPSLPSSSVRALSHISETPSLPSSPSLPPPPARQRAHRVTPPPRAPSTRVRRQPDFYRA